MPRLTLIQAELPSLLSPQGKRSGGGGDDFPCGRATGERNTSNVGMLDDGLADVWTKAVDEVEHAAGEANAFHHNGEMVGR